VDWRNIHIVDLRRWGLGRHKSVDDYTYGGGAGMVMRPSLWRQPWTRSGARTVR